MKKWSASRWVLAITVVQFFFTLTFYWFSYQKLSEKNGDEFNNTAFRKVQSEVENINYRYEKSTANYQHTIDSLNERLFFTDRKLQIAKAISSKSQMQLQYLLSKQWDTLSPEVKILECDSLREKTLEFITVGQSKDSLYERKLLGLTALHESTSRQLNSCDTTNQRLNEQINVALIHTRQCEEQLKKLKRRNRIFKIGTGIVAVIAGVIIFK